MTGKQPSPVLIFLKALSLAPISGNAKSAGAALLDHYNFRTKRLDPSQASLGRRLGIHRRAINDALTELVAFGFFTRDSHGGHAYHSAYQPNFPFAANIVTDFESRRQGAVPPAETSPLHPKNRPPKRSRRGKTSGDAATIFARRGSGDGATVPSGNGAAATSGDRATQTLGKNPLNLTRGPRPHDPRRPEDGSLAFGQEGQAAPRPPPEQHGALGEDILARQLAGRMRETERRRAAEGAWQRQLARVDCHLYERVMATMSETDAAYIKATEAELARPGGGLAWILAATGPPISRASKPT